MHNALAIALQGARPAVLPNLIMSAAFIAIFYFLLIRPQRKIAQEHRNLISNLKKGDDIMTEGGILGQVVHLAEDRITIKTAENTRIVISRQKVSRVFAPETGEAKKE
jgi:preprotein translocase subunit YajC